MAKGKGKAAPHQMPAHPTVNHPDNHPAHNKKEATKAYDGDVAVPNSASMPPPQAVARGSDFDGDDY